MFLQTKRPHKVWSTIPHDFWHQTQFTDRRFQYYLKNLNIKHNFTSVQHPYANMQAKSANRVILRGIRWWLDEAKGNWVEEIHTIIWAYRTTSQSSTDGFPFHLTYGTEEVIHIELNKLNWPTSTDTNFRANAENLWDELEFGDEIRNEATLKEAALK